MKTIKIACPQCKTKNKVPKDKRVFNCKKCSYTIFNNTQVKTRFKMLKKITGVSEKNEAKKREENLTEIRMGVNSLYASIDEDFGKRKLKDAEKKLLQLFNFDNSFDNKYLCLLLIQLNVSNTQDAYDAFRKLHKKKQMQILKSNYFQILHQNEIYREFLDDMIRHAFFKKKKKNERIEVSIMRRA